MFRNAIAYTITGLPSTGIEDLVAARALLPCMTTQIESTGWVPPRDGHPEAYIRNGHILLAYGSERKVLPSSVVKHVLKERVAALEEQQGNKVGRKQKNEMKLLVMSELLVKSFVTNQSTLVWVNSASNLMVINTTSQSKADSVVSLMFNTFSEACPEFTLRPINTEESISKHLTEWVLAGEVPGQFSIDRDCELKGFGEGGGRSAIRYVGHSLDTDNDGIRIHIEEGKFVTKLALTWNDRISFVVDEKMRIKQLSLLEVTNIEKEPDDDAYDADFLLFTGEFGNMWRDWAALVPQKQ